MAWIIINKDRCKGCLLCIGFCPKNLIKASSNLNKKGFVYAEFKGENECIGCAMCAVICPDCCIEVWK